ncbi:MAG: hypothetical protein WCR08_12150 [Gammaproteobacteria bacterium]
MKCLKMSSLFLCWCFVLLSACSTEAPVLGKWESVEKYAIGETSIEFFKDNTCVNSDKGSWACKYTTLNDGRIKIDMALGGVSFFGSLKGDEFQVVRGAKTDRYLRSGSDSLRKAIADYNNSPDLLEGTFLPVNDEYLDVLKLQFFRQNRACIITKLSNVGNRPIRDSDCTYEISEGGTKLILKETLSLRLFQDYDYIGSKKGDEIFIHISPNKEIKFTRSNSPKK